MSLSKAELQPLADELHQAEVERKPVESLSLRFPEMSASEARDIQFLNVARSLRDGNRFVGYKVGLTSAEAQRQFKVFQPDFGHLFDTMSIPENSAIDLQSLIQPKIECEIAFLLGKEMRGTGMNAADARRAIDCAFLCFEIVDSRFIGWKVNSNDLIADNGASARFVLSGTGRSLRDLNFDEMGMAFSQNGRVMITGASPAVLGNPVNAVVFLANELGKLGRGLSPGDIVLSGSLGAMLNINDGDFFDCEIQDLGRISVRFSSRKERV